MIPIEGSFELTVGSVCNGIPVTRTGVTGGHVQNVITLDTRTSDTFSKAHVQQSVVAHLEVHREMNAHYIIAHARRIIYMFLT